MKQNIDNITSSKTERKLFFPEGLTEKDIELIKEQCRIQSAESKSQIEGFARAYLDAKTIAIDQKHLLDLDAEDVEDLIQKWAWWSEKENQKGYRKVPVTFKNGSRALDAEKIPRAMNGFCQSFTSFLEDPTEDERFNTIELYKEFEKIHPFEDGNGRVGDLLWKILETRKTGQWPEELPPDVFGVNNK